MAATDPRSDAERLGEQMAGAAFAALTLPDVLTVASVVDHVASIRRRPITIVELPALAGTSTCGWWNAREHEDEILIAPPLSERHHDALVLHEVGHLILDHTGVVSADDNRITTIPGGGTGLGAASVPAGGVIRAERSHFADATEIAAELLADALARAIRRGPPRLSRFLSVFS